MLTVLFGFDDGYGLKCRAGSAGSNTRIVVAVVVVAIVVVVAGVETITAPCGTVLLLLVLLLLLLRPPGRMRRSPHSGGFDDGWTLFRLLFRLAVVAVVGADGRSVNKIF